MTTTRDAVLTRLKTTLESALLPTLHDLTVQRGGALPEFMSEDGVVVIRDGTPELDSAPLGNTGPWYWSHTVPVEIIVQAGEDAVRDARFDQIVEAIGPALDADETLGGLVHGLDYGPPAEPEESPVVGAEGFKHGIVEIVLDYETASRIC